MVGEAPMTSSSLEAAQSHSAHLHSQLTENVSPSRQYIHSTLWSSGVEPTYMRYYRDILVSFEIKKTCYRLGGTSGHNFVFVF
jgi:hypothetical protein